MLSSSALSGMLAFYTDVPTAMLLVAGSSMVSAAFFTARGGWHPAKKE
eukprot:COSAG01_NODE_1511_length_10068_cov_7.643731_9_plen_48_part_00